MLALASTCSQEWKHEPVAHSCLPLPCQNPLWLLLCFGLAEDIKRKTLTEGAELLVPSVSWAQFSPDLLALSLPRQLWLFGRPSKDTDPRKGDQPASSATGTREPDAQCGSPVGC